MLSLDEIAALEVLTSEGSFNFKGDPRKFLLFTEAERINTAYQLGPLFAVNCSIVDPLLHQVEAVYKPNNWGYSLRKSRKMQRTNKKL